MRQETGSTLFALRFGSALRVPLSRGLIAFRPIQSQLGVGLGNLGNLGVGVGV